MFRDRHEAGRLLAAALVKLELRNVFVMAVPRGGVPVAEEIASSLDAPLDLVIARKIGAPGNPEFAIGAVTQDGEAMLDNAVVKALAISKDFVEREAARKAEEVRERMKNYRGARPYPDLEGKTVVVVDDGIATGNTTRAAVRYLRKMHAGLVVLATPVAPSETLRELSVEADRIVCLETPEDFYAVGQFYENFEQVEDDEVNRILRRHWAKESDEGSGTDPKKT